MMKDNLVHNLNPAILTGQSKEGVLLVDKPKGKTSFSLVAALRKKTGVRKIGHAGTLDPFASGVMVMLIGSRFTKMSNQFLCQDKEYWCQIHLGITTDSYDCEGRVLLTSPIVPTEEEIKQALLSFQGSIQQIPPMFSAKKIGGKKLYLLARKGIEIERQPSTVTLSSHLIHYNYPLLELQIACSKGTYVRSIAHDLGVLLGCGGHLANLRRLRSGSFSIQNCIDGSLLYDHY